MTRLQAFKNGFWVHSAAIVAAAPDVNFYRVAAGHYAWADTTQPTTYAEADRGLALGIGMTPAAYNHDAGAGITATFRTQSAFATSGAAGGDLIFQVGSGDGAGRDGSVSIPGNGANSEMLGSAASAGGANASVFGNGAAGGGDNGVTVGQGAGTSVTGQDNTIVGQGACTTLVGGTDNVGVGHACDLGAGVTNCVVVGDSATSTFNTCVVLGSGSASTAINQFVCGSDNLAITDIYFGEGVTNATPPNITFHGTGGTGTDIAGGDLRIAGGISTGTGLGGDVIIQGTNPAAGTGAAANSLTEIARFIPDSDNPLGAGDTCAGFYTRRTVEQNTAGSGAPNVLTAGESFKVLTNEGSGAENHHNLPTAAPGLQYTFVVVDSDGMQVNAAAGDTIRLANQVSAAAGNIDSATIGNVVTLLAVNATEWYGISIVGTWNVT